MQEQIGSKCTMQRRVGIHKGDTALSPLLGSFMTLEGFVILYCSEWRFLPRTNRDLLGFVSSWGFRFQISGLGFGI